MQAQLLKFLAETSLPSPERLPPMNLPPKEPQRYEADVWSRGGSKRHVRIWNTLSLNFECDNAVGGDPDSKTLDGVLISMPRACRAQVIEFDKDGTRI